MRDRKNAAVTVHAGSATTEALDEIAGELIGVSRHAASVAALRIGVEVLRQEPARAVAYLADQRCGRRVRVRGTINKAGTS